MGIFNKKISLGSLTQSLSNAKDKVTETVKNIDMTGTVSNIKDAASNLSSSALEKTKDSYNTVSDKIGESYEKIKEKAGEIDYEKLKTKEFYQEITKEYINLGTNKITAYFKSTFEVDKSTMEMVNDIRGRLPVPAKTIDDIFDQCKNEAIRRAVSLFALNDLLEKLDTRSEEKYSKLSMSYKEWMQDNEYELKRSGTNYNQMEKIRDDARKSWNMLEDSYNKSEILYGQDADIEHIIAKKEYYNDTLIKIGTTNEELAKMIDSEENLVLQEHL